MWNFAQSALPFDRKARHVVTVLAGFRRTRGLLPVQNEALPEHVVAMLDLLPHRSPTTRSIVRVGPNSSRTACSSLCGGKRAGARSRSAGSSERTSGHSLRAGLASSAEIDERYVQKDLCRVGGNDPPLPGASRPLPDHRDQSCGLVDAPRGRRRSARHRRLARPPSFGSGGAGRRRFRRGFGPARSAREFARHPGPRPENTRDKRWNVEIDLQLGPV